MATFDRAPARVFDVIRQVIDEYYPDLVEAGARIGAVFAYPTLDRDGDPKGPPMVKDGRQILARIKRNSEEDRAAGKDDATITFDAQEWNRLDDEPEGYRQQRALVDHELHHLVVQREKDGSNRIRTDDKGRPLFKLRAHDWEITGFRAVVARHGEHSYEKQEARRFHDSYGNLLFDFAGEKSVRRDKQFAREVLGMTEQAVEEINRDHESAGMPAPFPNAKKPRKPRGAAVVAASNR